MVEFSIIIPTRNRPEALAHCLTSLTDLDFPEDAWEVIVVDDGGTDSLSAVTAELRQSLPLRPIQIEHAGPAAARNAGARIARGDYLAFTDDDCRVPSGWLKEFVLAFSDDGPPAAVGGRPVTPFADSPAGMGWQYLIDFLFEYMKDEHGNPLLLLSNNVAYRRSAFMSLGGFDESFPLAAGEDLDLSYRMADSGYRQCFHPELCVEHLHPVTAWGHLVQQFRYGCGGYYFRKAQQKLLADNHGSRRHPKSFNRTLFLSLLRSRLPLTGRAMIVAGQITYQLGHYYEIVRVLCAGPRRSRKNTEQAEQARSPDGQGH